jgi:hypothetical protein
MIMKTAINQSASKNVDNFQLFCMGMKHGFLPWWKGKKLQAITCKVLMKTYESNKDEQLSTLYND